MLTVQNSIFKALCPQPPPIFIINYFSLIARIIKKKERERPPRVPGAWGVGWGGGRRWRGSEEGEGGRD